MQIPAIFADGDYVHLISQNLYEEIIAFGNSKNLQYFTPVIINIQPVVDFYKTSAIISHYHTSDIADYISMILANLNPEIAFLVKKSDMQFYYLLFHKDLHNNNFIMQPFLMLLKKLLNLSSASIKILNTDSLQNITVQFE